MTTRGLTTKQRLFVEAYLATNNATEAARRAKYKGNDETLASVGKENLRKPQIAALINQRVESAIITADEVLNGIKEIAVAGQREADKLRAYELLGKHLSLFTDRQDVTVSGDMGVRMILPEGDDRDG